jgi:hypothetical protein
MPPQSPSITAGRSIALPCRSCHHHHRSFLHLLAKGIEPECLESSPTSLFPRRPPSSTASDSPPPDVPRRRRGRHHIQGEQADLPHLSPEPLRRRRSWLAGAQCVRHGHGLPSMNRPGLGLLG